MFSLFLLGDPCTNNIFIPDSHLNGAIAGDIVIVKRHNQKVQGNTRGTIEKILKRDKGTIMFDFIDHRLKPYNWPVDINVSLPDDAWYQIVEGSRIVLKLSLDKENDYQQMLEFACKAGAFTTMNYGAIPAMGDQDTIERTVK